MGNFKLSKWSAPQVFEYLNHSSLGNGPTELHTLRSVRTWLGSLFRKTIFKSSWVDLWFIIALPYESVIKGYFVARINQSVTYWYAKRHTNVSTVLKIVLLQLESSLVECKVVNRWNCPLLMVLPIGTFCWFTCVCPFRHWPVLAIAPQTAVPLHHGAGPVLATIELDVSIALLHTF